MSKQDNPTGFSKAGVGGHAARSMMYLEMRMLVQAMPLSVTLDDFVRAVVEENILEKPTLSSRKKSLRHLFELYGMDSTKALFRVFWDLAHSDSDSLPQLCLICAYARDPQLRHSFELVRSLRLDFGSLCHVCRIPDRPSWGAFARLHLRGACCTESVSKPFCPSRQNGAGLNLLGGCRPAGTAHV